MSCNGCRVLRKGCSRECVLRPSLEWIKSSESQANATIFLAKFYGRAGLINLINAGPVHLYPEIFKSLLYEACGRIINPVEGALGLWSSNGWSRCQAAVDAVLDGKPLIVDGLRANADPTNDLQRYGDIRHLSTTVATAHRVKKNHHRFKKAASPSPAKNRSHRSADHRRDEVSKFTITGWELKVDRIDEEEEEVKRAPSHDSLSVETVEPDLADPVLGVEPDRLDDMNLELTLGF